MKGLPDLQTRVEIFIDGIDGPIRYSNLSIYQPIHGHHSFRFLWRLDLQSVMDMASREDMAQKFLGKPVHI